MNLSDSQEWRNVILISIVSDQEPGTGTVATGRRMVKRKPLAELAEDSAGLPLLVNPSELTTPRMLELTRSFLGKHYCMWHLSQEFQVG